MAAAIPLLRIRRLFAAAQAQPEVMENRLLVLLVLLVLVLLVLVLLVLRRVVMLVVRLRWAHRHKIRRSLLMLMARAGLRPWREDLTQWEPFARGSI